MQLLVSENPFVAGFAFPDERSFVAPSSIEMPIETIFRDVDLAADKPFRERRLPFQDFFPWLLPVEIARFTGPEFFRMSQRFAMHPPVLLEATDPGLLRKITGRFEDAIFLQVRLDVFFHDRSRTLAALFACSTQSWLWQWGERRSEECFFGWVEFRPHPAIFPA